MVGYATAGEIDWAVAGLVTAGSLAGALAGTRWLRTLSGPALQWAFAALMVVTAVRLVLGGEGDGPGRGGLTVRGGGQPARPRLRRRGPGRAAGRRAAAS